MRRKNYDARHYLYLIGIICTGIHFKGGNIVMVVYYVALGVLFAVGMVEVVEGVKECNERDI